MARIPGPRVLAEVLRSGNLRARLRAAPEGLTGVRLQLIAAALDLGLLDALGEGPAGTEQLAERLRATDRELLTAYLRVLAAAGLITGERSWRLTRSGRAVLGDDVVRATYEGFGGYHAREPRARSSSRVAVVGRRPPGRLLRRSSWAAWSRVEEGGGRATSGRSDPARPTRRAVARRPPADH